MKRKVVAILLAVMVSIMVIFGVALGTNRPAQAEPDDLGICLPNVVCATVSVPVPVTVRATVRVTRIITLPPVVQTIIRPPVTLPGPVRTVTVQQPGLPGATKTATVVVSRQIISNGTAPPVTREVRSTISAGQNVGSSGKVVPSKEVTLPGKTKTVTKFRVVGLSLLGLILLMGLGLFLLWLGFILGYKSSEKENTNFLRALRDTIRRRPGKHE